MPLFLDISGFPLRTSEEAAKLANKVMADGDHGGAHLLHALRFLIDASKRVTPYAQANALITSWCHARQAARRTHSCLPNLAFDLVPALENWIKLGMTEAYWVGEIESPLQLSLVKAKSRKRTLAVSEKGVREWRKFHEVFEIAESSYAERLSLSFFDEPWCLPVAERHIAYWREQLAFVQMRMAEEERECAQEELERWLCPCCSTVNSELDDPRCTKCDYPNGGLWLPEDVRMSHLKTINDRKENGRSIDADSAKSFPFLQWLTVGNGKPWWRDVRPEHAILHGKVFHWNDAIWALMEPPTDEMCRCTAVSLTENQVATEKKQLYSFVAMNGPMPVLRELSSHEVRALLAAEK